MSTAESLLATVAESDLDIIRVDSDLRTITIPSTIANLGVTSDDDVKRLRWSIPRTYHGIDLSEYTIRINYTNAHNEGDIYTPDDVTISDETLDFSWLVGRHAFLYAGNVSFGLCLRKIDADGVVLSEFNTFPASLPVLQGLETEKSITDEAMDLVKTVANEAAKKAAADVNLDNYVQKTDYATVDDYGLVRAKAGYGIENRVDGYLGIVCANTPEIKAGSSKYKPITPANLKAAITLGLSKIQGLRYWDGDTWTNPDGTEVTVSRTGMDMMHGAFAGHIILLCGDGTYFDVFMYLGEDAVGCAQWWSIGTVTD